MLPIAIDLVDQIFRYYFAGACTEFVCDGNRKCKLKTELYSFQMNIVSVAHHHFIYDSKRLFNEIGSVCVSGRSQNAYN